MNDTKKLKELLQPYHGAFTSRMRVGNPNRDGGYILSYEGLLYSSYVMSYGIGILQEQLLFDLDCAKLGKPVYMFDHTIDFLTVNHDLFTFVKEPMSSENMVRHINEIPNKYKKNHMSGILKADVEGCEYDVFLNNDLSLFVNNFNQITIEMHDVLKSENAIPLLEKLNNDFIIFHIHANNHEKLIEDGICNTLELSFINKRFCNGSYGKIKGKFPIQGLDKPCCLELPEIEIEF